ncbi:MAG: GAF domain-containing protein [Pseudomonadota bacterium]
MRAPPLPHIEARRLESLWSSKLLDSPQEERFDRITRTATRLFSVPIAMVSLVDKDRQWFKSVVGLPVRQTPRDVSFCGHAILERDIFVVEDALKDSRFIDNPLVVDAPNIRFYAGCPVHDVDGLPFGTLCIIDTKPREFSREDCSALSDLAAMVESEIAISMLAAEAEFLDGTSDHLGMP